MLFPLGDTAGPLHLPASCHPAWPVHQPFLRAAIPSPGQGYVPVRAPRDTLFCLCSRREEPAVTPGTRSCTCCNRLSGNVRVEWLCCESSCHGRRHPSQGWGPSGGTPRAGCLRSFSVMLQQQQALPRAMIKKPRVPVVGSGRQWDQWRWACRSLAPAPRGLRLGIGLGPGIGSGTRDPTKQGGRPGVLGSREAGGLGSAECSGGLLDRYEGSGGVTRGPSSARLGAMADSVCRPLTEGQGEAQPGNESLPPTNAWSPLRPQEA